MLKIGALAGTFLLLFATAIPARAQEPISPSAQLPGLDVVSLPNAMTVKKMAVTNRDFKLYNTKFEFKSGMEDYAAQLTEKEAQDYTIWTGKTYGKDLVWRAAPNSQVGFLLIAGSGMEVVAQNASAPPKEIPAGMVYIAEGGFPMGSDKGDMDEKPRHQAITKPYFIDKFEVGNAEYKAQFPEFSFPAGKEEFPAIVTWDQAAAYAQKVGKRLPTEAEWERAARGDDGRTFPWGETFDWTFVNWDQTSPRNASPARPESPYGCYDMAGSAWEWTSDWYQPYAGNTTPSEAYGEKFKVIRGGASYNDISMFRCSHRYYLPPNTTGKLYVGFRCAMDVPAE